MDSKEIIKKILFNGTNEEKRALFSFNLNTSNEKILKKFKLFSRYFFIRYFSEKEASFHDGMILRTFQSYKGQNIAEISFRGSSKTTLKKLIRVFVLLNDEDNYRKYLKILCRDLTNSKQIVTDIYNLCLETASVYGDIFEQQKEKKVEETMMAFTMSSGVKITAGTVGQKQRGHIQDAYRPDWIWFEDIEDVESISSQAITEGVIKRCDEAITGLSRNGSWELTGNYISDTGSVQWFLDKKSLIKSIIPIATDFKVINGKIVEIKPTWEIYSVAQIQSLYDNSLDFYGDYLCDPKRSENKFFDIERIEKDMVVCRLPDRKSGLVKYWNTYKPYQRYGQGSDHSEGVGEDSNTLAGFNYTTGELIYTYASNEVSPDIATYEFMRVGEEFGNCIWLPEVNNKCGGIVIASAISKGYPRIYRQKVIKNGVEMDGQKMGWDTNSKTKNTMFFEFKRDYNDGLIKIYDIEVLKEMKSYTQSDLKDSQVGLITRHFDLLTAVVIAWQGRKEDEYKHIASVSYND